MTLPPSIRRAGFSLIETLVALTLIGVTLLLAMSLLAQEPGMARRLAAQEEVLGILDVVHESLRAGHPLPDGTEPLDWQSFFEAGYAPRTAETLQIWSEVTPHSGRGLDQVVLRARWSADGRTFERTVQTLVWGGR